MALAHLQTGFREMLRLPSKESGSPSRKRAVSRVRGLAPAEREALLGVPDDRLAVYHDLVLGGHKHMAGWLFGHTFGLLRIIEREHPDLASGTTPREIVEAFVADRFATTHSLRELADCLGAFLRKQFARAFKAIPLLGEVACFERFRFDVEVVADGPGEAATDPAIQELASKTVGRLLSTRLLVPTHVRGFQVRYDVFHALAVLGQKGAAATLGEIVRPASAVAVLTRNPVSLLPMQQAMEVATWKDLCRFAPGKPFRIEELALVRRKRGPRGETDEQALERIVSEAFRMLQTGVLFFAPVRRSSPRRKSSPARSGR